METNKSVTAVEWLVEQLKDNNMLTFDEWTEIIDQAKAMEKEQITEAYKTGARYALISQSDLALIKGKFPTPEQYYNETFKSE